MNETKKKMGCVLAVAGLALAMESQAAFQDPATSAWGGWTRGDVGSFYAGWDLSTDVADPGVIDNSPDLLASTLIGGGTTAGPAVASIGAGPFRVAEQPVSGAFIISSGNIYNPTAATSFVVDVGGAASAGPVRVALQVRTLGNELDYAGVRVNGVLAAAYTELGREPFPGPGGSTVDSLFVWTLAAGADLYSFTFNAAQSSMSLDALTVDVAPVPLPAPIVLLGSAVAGLAAWRRHLPGAAS
ncbi:MAG TPA: hypothetical protein PJ986_17255 [Gammaproteobacteria bacterium]|nr:hypothetical protein [Gammaproteobacteria bacterium]